ncbi:MAG: DUF4339 domain-containing protein [bacterium]
MKIYITRGDQRAGPYTLAQINAFLNIGRLSLDDHAWYEGCLDWIKVKGIPGVRVVSSQSGSSHSAPQQPKQTMLHALVTHPKTERPEKVKRAANRPAQRATRIPCRICESGELLKTTLPRFSRSLNALGLVLLLMSLVGVAAILLAMIPYDTASADAAPISIVIAGTQQVDLSHAGSSLLSLKKFILANWQFIFLSSFAGFIFFFLFQTKKHVLQCSYCESVVAIE